jgi:hypothetical protein
MSKAEILNGSFYARIGKNIIRGFNIPTSLRNNVA